jgi:hypothetical protein
VVTCKNCGSPVAENFCPKCGQKADTHRFTVRHIFHNFFHSFTHVDSGLLYLIKELFIRPGTVIREYIEGRRKKYFNPFQYLVLSIAAMVFVMVKFNLGTLILGNVHITGDKALVFQAQFTSFLYQYINIFQFITLPILSGYSYLFFRKSGFNYAENLVLNTFLSAQRHLLFILVIPFLLIFPDSAKQVNSFYLAIWMIYMIWTYISFFKPKSKVWAGIKTFIVSTLFFITNALLLLAIFYLFFYKSPVL